MQTKICFPHSKQISHTSQWCGGMARDGRPRPSGTRSAHCLNHSLGSTEMHWETNVSHIGWLAIIWTWPALWFHLSMRAWKHGLSNSLNIHYAPAVIQAEPGTRRAAVKDTGVSPLYSLSFRSSQFLCFCSRMALSLGWSSFCFLLMEIPPIPEGPVWEHLLSLLHHAFPQWEWITFSSAPKALCFYSVWNSTVGIWSKCRLSPYFSCLYFPPTSPKLVGPDLP